MEFQVFQIFKIKSGLSSPVGRPENWMRGKFKICQGMGGNEYIQSSYLKTAFDQELEFVCSFVLQVIKRT